MSLFATLNTEGVERTEDRTTSSSGFSILESGAYEATIKTAYAGTSKSGALNVTLICNIQGQEYSETIYITNRNKEPYYTDQQRKKHFIPGYNIINSICQLTTGKTLKEMETEEKVLNVYSPTEGKQVPTPVPVLSDLAGKQVVLGILHEVRNKATLNDQGVYVDTPESRDENRINAVFDIETKKTLNEKLDGKESVFYVKWLEKNQGKTVDRRTIKDGNATKVVITTDPKPRTSLFAK